MMRIVESALVLPLTVLLLLNVFAFGITEFTKIREQVSVHETEMEEKSFSLPERVLSLSSFVQSWEDSYGESSE